MFAALGLGRSAPGRRVSFTKSPASYIRKLDKLTARGAHAEGASARRPAATMSRINRRAAPPMTDDAISDEEYEREAFRVVPLASFPDARVDLIDWPDARIDWRSVAQLAVGIFAAGISPWAQPR